MLRKKKFIGSIILLIVLWHISHAQVSINDLNLDGNIDDWYSKTMDDTPPQFLQGMEYKIEGQTIDQHQYYRSLSWKEGDLVFAGREFKQVKLLYNIYEDVLITLNFGIKTDRVPAILLNQSKIGGFTIYETTFINLNVNQPPPTGNGIYEVYFSGNEIAAFQKHRKELNRFNSGLEYRYSTKLYIQFQDKYHKVNKKRDLYQIFPGLKAQIKEYSNKNLVRISKRRLVGLQGLLKYIDSRVKE